MNVKLGDVNTEQSKEDIRKDVLFVTNQLIYICAII